MYHIGYDAYSVFYFINYIILGNSIGNFRWSDYSCLLKFKMQAF